MSVVDPSLILLAIITVPKMPKHIYPSGEKLDRYIFRATEKQINFIKNNGRAVLLRRLIDEAIAISQSEGERNEPK